MSIQPASEIPPEDLAIAVAHSADTVLNNLGHANRHAIAVQLAGTPESRAYNLKHLAGHVQRAGRHQRKHLEILARYRPDFAAELARLDEATQLAGRAAIPAPDDDVPPDSRAATIMHLGVLSPSRSGTLSSTRWKAQKAPDSASRTFHMRHCSKHIGEALEHERKAVAALVAYFPEIGDEVTSLAAVTSPASRAPVDADRSAGLAGQRCNYCGELSPCIDLECPGSGAPWQSVQERAHDELAAQFAAGSLWDGAL